MMIAALSAGKARKTGASVTAISSRAAYRFDGGIAL
jgi:hypothetical protein